MSKQYLIHLPPLFLVAVVGFIGFFTWRTIDPPSTPTPTPAVLVASTPSPTATATSTPTPTPTNTATATLTPEPIPITPLDPVIEITQGPFLAPFRQAPHPPPEPEPAITMTVPINLIARQRPNSEAEVAVWLPEGVQVGVNGRNIAKTWLNVTAPGGQSGWVTVSATEAKTQGINVDRIEIMLAGAIGGAALAAVEPNGGEEPSTEPPVGEIILLSPTSADGRFFSDVDFVWEWDGQELPPEFGFELLIWEPRVAPISAHNAADDNRNGKIQALGDNRYRFNLDVTYAPGVRGREDVYRWTVRLVRIEPAYDDLGEHPIVADHKEFSFGPF